MKLCGSITLLFIFSVKNESVPRLSCGLQGTTLINDFPYAVDLDNDGRVSL